MDWGLCWKKFPFQQAASGAGREQGWVFSPRSKEKRDSSDRMFDVYMMGIAVHGCEAAG